MAIIKCNYENKKKIINNLNNCISNLDDVNKVFKNTIIPYDFYYINSLNDIKKIIVTTKNDLNNYKNDINNCLENMNKNELELLSKINKIDDLVIDRF